MGRLARALVIGAATTVGVAGCGFGADDGRVGPSASRAPASGSGSSTRGESPATTGDEGSRPPVSFTLLGSGDLLTHVPVRRSAERYAKAPAKYDFRPMFANVRSSISAADVAICHMETPLSPTDTNLSRPGILVFNTPHELIDGVKDAGWDGCDFASNHSYDRGITGINDTRKVITGAGLQYAGPNGDPQRPEAVAWYTAKGVRFASLAYRYTILKNWGPNTDTPPEGRYLSAALWPARKAAGIIADAKKARAAGAQVVVVSLHWGAEYQTAPTAEQKALATALLSSPDVDLILGTHVHVVQPCQRINGKFVFYGLGNFLSNQGPASAAELKPETQEGIFATVTFTRGADGRFTQSATFQPTRVRLDGHVIERTSRTSQAQSWSRVVEDVGSMPGGCPAVPLGR